jgi:glycosyltransferase involved in cell wall biosynthesis
VGAGPDEATLRQRAVAARIDEQITFAPPQPLQDVLRRGAILVVPSWKESLPYVVIEAAAVGHPIVATNAGGIAEIPARSPMRLFQLILANSQAHS